MPYSECITAWSTLKWDHFRGSIKTTSLSPRAFSIWSPIYLLSTKSFSHKCPQCACCSHAHTLLTIINALSTHQASQLPCGQSHGHMPSLKPSLSLPPSQMPAQHLCVFVSGQPAAGLLGRCFCLPHCRAWKASKGPTHLCSQM